MKSVGRIPRCGRIVIISVTGGGIKCLNMEIRVLDASIRLEHSVHRVAGYPSIVSVFLFVIVVRIGGSQGLHLGAALSFILQVTDQIVSGNFYGLKGFPSHW